MKKHSTTNIQRSTSKWASRGNFLGRWKLNVECSMFSRLSVLVEKSGGGPPQSKTLARGTLRLANAKRPGVRQPSGALTGGTGATCGAVVYPNVFWRGILPANMIAKNKAEIAVVVKRSRGS